jgi:hypothetical protein
MLLACTTSYIQDKSVRNCQFSDEELQQISSLAGECVLSSLERKLTPAELERCAGGVEYLQALYLVLLGTILAVGYMQPFEESSTIAHASVSNWVSLSFAFCTQNHKRTAYCS